MKSYFKKYKKHTVLLLAGHIYSRDDGCASQVSAITPSRIQCPRAPRSAVGHRTKLAICILEKDHRRAHDPQGNK